MKKIVFASERLHCRFVLNKESFLFEKTFILKKEQEN